VLNEDVWAAPGDELLRRLVADIGP
jgi:hypothetical protein